MKPKAEVMVLTGPTAVGKTRLAMTVAERFVAEIISADSRQVYRYLNIGTAKPSLEERKRVPHHLIDFLELKQRYSAAAFARDARRKMEELEAGGRRFLVVGGTGLYLKALVEGLSPIPEVDPEISERLKRQAEESGLDLLYQRLGRVDPLTAARLSSRDRSRILRALEVFEATGRPISEWQQHPRIRDGRNYRLLVLNLERKALYRQIEKRVETMMAAGLVDEVRDLLTKGQGRALEHIRAVGYQEVMSYLKGETDLPTAIALIKQHTRWFAKRQLTWFRSLKNAEGIDASDFPAAVERITASFKKL